MMKKQRKKEQELRELLEANRKLKLEESTLIQSQTLEQTKIKIEAERRKRDEAEARLKEERAKRDEERKKTKRTRMEII